MNTNQMLILAIVAVLVIFVMVVFRKRKDKEETDELVYSIDELVEFSENVIQEAISASKVTRYDSDFKKEQSRKKEMRKALRTCMVGDIPNKLYVKSYLRDSIVSVYDMTHDNLNKIIPFNNPERLTAMDKFDILLYWYSLEHGYDAINAMVKEFDLARPRVLEYVDGNPVGYAITSSDIHNIYSLKKVELTEDHKIDIVVQRVYQTFKGLGPIDELRDQNIDGLNGGTSGLPPGVANKVDLIDYNYERKFVPRSYDACWMFYKGVSMHLEFMSFGSEEELRRVCEIIFSYDSPGEIDQETGHKINEMADQSRIVVVGPKFADSWAFFMRKFDPSIVELEKLWTQDGTQFLIETIEFAAKGGATMAVTGQQGSGKTVAMKASVGKIYHHHNIRVQEGSSFELWLRAAYPYRNLTTFRETTKMSGEDGIVVQKKTDGAINMVGEVADDPVFGLVMKTAQVASLFSWFTHHASTAVALVDAARDALVNTRMQPDPRMAEAYVVRVLDLNLHLVNIRGDRHAERVTEFIPLELDNEEFDETFREMIDSDPLKAIARAFIPVVQYLKKSKGPLYKTQDILVYKDGRYMPGERPSDRLLAKWRKNLTPEDCEKLDAYLNKYWPSQGSAPLRGSAS